MVEYRTREDRRMHPWIWSGVCNHKPLSINAAYYRNKKKTVAYRAYEDAWQLTLSGLIIPEDIEIKDMLFRIDYVWGFSNNASDVDNPIKTTTDIMQNWWKFNDKQVRVVKATKTLVPKTCDFAEVKITEIFKEDMDNGYKNIFKRD